MGSVLKLSFAIAIATSASQLASSPTPAVAQPVAARAVQSPAIPQGKETDVKFYAAAGGHAVIGRDALEKMPSAGLVLWLAGNQFFAMDDVIGAFQKAYPSTSVGLITLPPGLLLQAIKAGGWTFDGGDYRGVPDVYASVSLGHLKQLKAAGMMDSYIVYMHNELQIMVARGTPRRLRAFGPSARGRSHLDAEPGQRGHHAVLHSQGAGAARHLADHIGRQGVRALPDHAEQLVHGRPPP